MSCLGSSKWQWPSRGVGRIGGYCGRENNVSDLRTSSDPGFYLHGFWQSSTWMTGGAVRLSMASILCSPAAMLACIVSQLATRLGLGLYFPLFLAAQRTKLRAVPHTQRLHTAQWLSRPVSPIRLRKRKMCRILESLFPVGASPSRRGSSAGQNVRSPHLLVHCN